MALDTLKDVLKNIVPRDCLYLYRLLRDRRDLIALVKFVLKQHKKMSRFDKAALVRRMYRISDQIKAPHSQEEIISYIDAILAIPSDREGVIVEAGCFKGASTSKFSFAAAATGRELVVFDSFRGIPEHNEDHGRNIFGNDVGFQSGTYCGSFEEVTSNIARHGNIDCCRLIEGWFDETMPDFAEPIVAVYLDVDLASSTYSCLAYLYPLLISGGVLFSQDGHLPLVIDVFRDRKFWTERLGCEPPVVVGLGSSKLIRMVKP